MVIEVVQNVVYLSGNLTVNCWEALKHKVIKTLRQCGEITIYCDAIASYTLDGLRTFVDAAEFASLNQYQIDVAGLTGDMEAAIDAVTSKAAPKPVSEPPLQPTFLPHYNMG